MILIIKIKVVEVLLALRNFHEKGQTKQLGYG